MVKAILVPLDGSPFGEHALPFALCLARRAQAAVKLLHVHQITPLVPDAGGAFLDHLELALKKEERNYLDEIAHKLAALAPALTFHPVLLAGEAAGVIEEYVEREKIDLVVMSTHGRGALGRFWLGSVADDLVRHLAVPILLVRPGDEPVDLGKEPVLARFLLPLDGTPLAEQILEPAAKFAELVGAEYTLVRVVHPIGRLNYSWPNDLTPGGLTGIAWWWTNNRRSVSCARPRSTRSIWWRWRRTAGAGFRAYCRAAWPTR